MEQLKPILFNVPISLLEQLDFSASELNLTRSELLRRSLRRDLEFVICNEIKRHRETQAQNATHYLEWAKHQSK